MSLVSANHPDLPEGPLHVFLFARWNREKPPPVGTLASWRDLNYYLRAMRGPYWKITVPLCVHGASEEDIRRLEAALAYMETTSCSRWFYPMDAWTPTRVFLIMVHAWATQDARLRSYDWRGFRDLIPHVTPYPRSEGLTNMQHTIAGLARLAKEFFPLDIYHYKWIPRKEHAKATGYVTDVVTWRDAATQTDEEGATETEGLKEDIGTGRTEQGRQRLEQGRSNARTEGDVYTAEDPRETHSISIHASALPRLFSDGILLQIPL